MSRTLRQSGLERLLPDLERLVELRVADDERAEHADAVRVDPGLEEQQAARGCGLGDRRRELGRRLHRLAVGDELDREHRAEPADVADRRKAVLPAHHPLAHGLADRPRALDESLLLEDVEDGQRGRLRDRVADVGAADRGVGRRVHDLGAADHPREREAGGDRLRDDHEVGLDAVVLDRPHATGPSVARLHLVDDEHDPVLVADPTHSAQELARRDDEAALALHGLDDDRRHLLGRDLRHERPPEVAERLGRRRATVVLREREPVHLRRERTLAATAVVEGTAGAPYEEGLLALREGPLLEAAIRALEEPPDVLLVNATGRDHPRRAGLAVHLGAMLELPTIGVTHRPLLATGAWPDDAHGATAPLELDGELVGRWVRTRAGRRPLAVHAAWRTDPDLATRLVLDQCGARTPEPLRQARRVARRMRSGHA